MSITNCAIWLHYIISTTYKVKQTPIKNLGDENNSKTEETRQKLLFLSLPDLPLLDNSDEDNNDFKINKRLYFKFVEIVTGKLENVFLINCTKDVIQSDL